MPIIFAKPERKFPLCPEGVHHAVLVDVIDVGVQSTPWGDKPKVDLRWQTADRDLKSGQRFEVGKRYTNSLHEKADLRHDLETWRGKAFTEDELEDFDGERLLGQNCNLSIAHKEMAKGRTIAIVQAVIPYDPKTPKLAPDSYIRVKDRTQSTDEAMVDSTNIRVDGIPF